MNDDRHFVANVLTEGGKIKAVGEDIQCPSDAKVIDATGKYVIPGKHQIFHKIVFFFPRLTYFRWN